MDSDRSCRKLLTKIISAVLITSLLPYDAVAQVYSSAQAKKSETNQSSVYNLPDINLGSYGLGVKGEAPGISLKDVKMAVNGTVGIGQ
ncbi:MAG: hypothetical protein FWF35_02325, partial [Elusimicrobia bacterium]|nr:hypothetical protein [Elusimicrobiota bacterium]